MTGSEVLSTDETSGRSLLEIQYELFAPGMGEGFEKAASGRNQVELLGEGQFHYVSNKMQFE